MEPAAQVRTADEAIRILDDFERKVGSLTSPRDLYDLFSKTRYTVTETKRTISVVGQDDSSENTETTRQFEIRGDSQGREATERVLATMKEVLLLASGTAEPKNKTLLDRFEQQLSLVQQMASARPAQTSTPPQEESAEPQDVKGLMAELQEQKINCYPSPTAKAFLAFIKTPFLPFLAFGRGEAGIAIGTVCIALTALSFAIFPAAAVAWGLLGLAAVGAVVGAVGTFIYYALKERSIKRATELNQVIQAFGGMAAAGRAYALVKLGPEFRKRLKASDQEVSGSGFFGGDHWPVRKFCDYVDTMTDPEVPEGVKESYHKQLAPELKRWSEVPIILKLLGR